MNEKIFSQRVICGILVTLLLAGCGAPTAKPVPEYVEEPIKVTFDGEECIASTPAVMSTGEHSFVFVYTTEQGYGFWVEQLLDGKTYQDALDLQSEPGEYIPPQPWIDDHDLTVDVEWDESAGANIYTWSLDEEGEYIMMTGGTSPPSVWFCGSFQVVEAP
jgi:hypothetical protein